MTSQYTTYIKGYTPTRTHSTGLLKTQTDGENMSFDDISGRRNSYTGFVKTHAPKAARLVDFCDLLDINITDLSKQKDYLENKFKMEEARTWDTTGLGPDPLVKKIKNDDTTDNVRLTELTGKDEKGEFIKKMLNSIVLYRRDASSGIHLTSLVYSDENTKNNAIYTIYDALYFLYGCKYVFRDVNAASIFGFLQNKKFTAIIKGQRNGDNVKPEVQLIIVTSDCDLYNDCLRKESTWGEVLTLKVVLADCKPSSKKCTDLADQYHGEAMYVAFRRQLAVPRKKREVALLLIHIYRHLEKLVEEKSLVFVESATNNVYYINPASSPQNNHCTTEILLHRIVLSPDVFVFMCHEPNTSRFLCWLETATKAKEEKSLLVKDVNAWPALKYSTEKVIKVFPQQFVKLELDQYKKACEAIMEWIVKALEHVRQTTSNNEGSCCDTSTYIHTNLIQPMKCFIEYVKSIKDEPSTLCNSLIHLKFSVWQLLEAYVKALRASLNKAEGAMKYDASLMSYVEGMYCILVKYVMPVVYEVVTRLDLFYLALVLHYGKQETGECLVTYPSRNLRVLRLKIIIWLMSHEPLLFPDKEKPMALDFKRLEKYLVQDNEVGRMCTKYLRIQKSIEQEEKSSLASYINESIEKYQVELDRIVNEALVSKKLSVAQANALHAVLQHAIYNTGDILGDPHDYIKAIAQYTEDHITQMREMLVRVYKQQRTALEITARLLENLGTPNLFVNRALQRDRDAMEILPGLSTLLSGRDNNDNDLMTMMSSVHGTSTVDTLLKRLHDIQRSIKNPSGLETRNASLDDMDDFALGLNGGTYMVGRGPDGSPKYNLVGTMPELRGSS